MQAHYNFSFYSATFYAAFISNNLWNSESYSPSAIDWQSIFSRFRQMNHGTMDICNKFLWNEHFFSMNWGHRWYFRIQLWMLYFLCIAKNSVSKLFGYGSTVNCRLWLFYSCGVKTASFFRASNGFAFSLALTLLMGRLTLTYTKKNRNKKSFNLNAHI